MNSVNITGNLTRKADLNVTSSGTKVATFTIAVNDGKDKNGKEIVDYPTCKAWDKIADVIDQYTDKGSKVAVTGKIKTRSYDDKDGKKVYVTEIKVDRLELMGTKNKENTGSEDQEKKENHPGWEHEIDIKSDDLPF